MVGWADHEQRMNRIVDDTLGDDVPYKRAGEAVFTTRKAFVLLDTMQLGIDGLDSSLGKRWRLKISKEFVPYPDVDDRFSHPRLGDGMFRPSNELPAQAGAYWEFDVQKVDDE